MLSLVFSSFLIQHDYTSLPQFASEKRCHIQGAHFGSAGTPVSACQHICDRTCGVRGLASEVGRVM